MLSRSTGPAPDAAPGSLLALRFDNCLVNRLPADPNPQNTRRAVYGACYSRVEPTSVRAPSLVAYSKDMARRLGLSPAECASEQFLKVFSGNETLPPMAPHAACYGGHQFGSWAGQLGDGRAISLGEVVNADGERWELQLKGAGPTPYSRKGDGRAVLRSSLREFLCSEAMHHLGIPTTRALSLVLTGEGVERDMFYDGHPRVEPGAIVCRTSPSFLRFGNFELPAHRNDVALLKQWVDFAIQRDFPELGPPTPEACIAWLTAIAERTARLVVHWMRVGFVHGVMNTDNMSILGLTIDYGPYGWLDEYNPAFTPNTTDSQGRRYRFENQPRVALWNLVRLANALEKLGLPSEDLNHAVSAYADTFNREYPSMQAKKLGLAFANSDADDTELEQLLVELQELLLEVETDHTLFFRSLAAVLPASGRTISLTSPSDSASPEGLLRPILKAFYAPDALPPEYVRKLSHWLLRYENLCRNAPSSRAEQIATMNAVNPSIIPRNYLAQEAIRAAETGDFTELHALASALTTPYAAEHEGTRLAAKRPEWARHQPGCSMLSCSS
ncbi:MAG: YdiU family protein [Polyangiaceae bacterium]|nr:YdiU family protein [Polyangiaceae bacterium]